jgi:hypothetical protein
MSYLASAADVGCVSEKEWCVLIRFLAEQYVDRQDDESRRVHR